MALIDIHNFNFTYPNAKQKALTNINVSIEDGEFVVICGPSGCGKTTLLSQLKREISPEGELSGEIYYKGKPIKNISKGQAVKEIGLVFQDPEDQIVVDTVIHELAFSMENIGYTKSIMKKRLAEMANFFGLEKILYKPVLELSGGEKQIINLASVLLLQPKVLLLDEPTSQLDPVAAKQFLQMLYRLNRELSTTIIMSEHRLEDVLPMADKVLLMQRGRLKYCGSPRKVSHQVIESEDNNFLNFLPTVVKMYSCFTGNTEQDKMPLDVREAKTVISRFISRTDNKKIHITDDKNRMRNQKSPILSIKGIDFRYEKDAPNVLNNLSLDVFKGELISVLGGNGTGKSTLLQVIAGLRKPQRGKIYLEGTEIFRIAEEERYQKIGYLAQNPMLYFINDTVEDELYKRADALKTKVKHVEKLLEDYVNLFGLKNLLSRHPYDLSGGEKQKLAITTVLLSAPKIILMDEPTKGLDPSFKLEFGEILKTLTKSGATLILVSHDIEFVARISTSCALLFGGEIASKDSPRIFFSKNYFYTTAVNRTVREMLPNAITLEDVLKTCKITSI
ncbi:MAG: ABC transporter ATP-binding protein [Tepidanaerobacteraceae bacterium]|jgi:energy-coupling factor transporter ATP-binding protein EcfA2